MGTCLVYIGIYANKILKIQISHFAHTDAQKNSAKDMNEVQAENGYEVYSSDIKI